MAKQLVMYSEQDEPMATKIDLRGSDRPHRNRRPEQMARDTSADGLGNRIEAYLLSHFSPLWRVVQQVDPVRHWMNRYIINRAATRAPPRPHTHGSMAVGGNSSNDIADYPSWEMLCDTTWFGRHLPANTLGEKNDPRGELPDPEALAELFHTEDGKAVLSEDSNVLFLSFAQWFTDGFLMSDPVDTRRTHTSHHIDLNSVYGLSRSQTLAVRLQSEASGTRGRLKTEIDPKTGEVFPPRYFDADGNVKPEFSALRPPIRLERVLEKASPERARAIKSSLFAFAGERANSTPYTAALNTLFLREHNRLAALIEQAHPGWDDERVFQTARNVNMVLLIKIVVEEYINHISPYHFRLQADPGIAWRAQWNRANWIAIEFNLLYRWHSLVPERFEIGDEMIPAHALLFDNSPLIRSGLGGLLESASRQRSRRVGLFNTPAFLLDTEVASIRQGRRNRLASYNDYRERFGFGRVTRFEQITGDPKRVEALKRLYKDVDRLEFFVGLFAEDVPSRSAVPPLIGRMVAFDAFTQALTNPILSKGLYNVDSFSKPGLEAIAATSRLQDILARNLPGDGAHHDISLTLNALSTAQTAA